MTSLFFVGCTPTDRLLGNCWLQVGQAGSKTGILETETVPSCPSTVLSAKGPVGIMVLGCTNERRAV